MRGIGRIGSILMIGVVLVAVIVGFQTPQGRVMWDGLWAAGSVVVGFIWGGLNRLGVTAGAAGNVWKSLGIAMVGAFVLGFFVPGLRAGRGAMALAVVTGLTFLALFQPGVLSMPGGVTPASVTGGTSSKCSTLLAAEQRAKTRSAAVPSSGLRLQAANR